MSRNPLDSWTQEQINPDHFEHFLFFSYDTWMFFKMCKGISCLVSEPRYVTNISFLSLGSVTVLLTDMVKKRCTGANPSAALDSMKAGTCVSVSSAFFLALKFHTSIPVLVWIPSDGWLVEAALQELSFSSVMHAQLSLNPAGVVHMQMTGWLDFRCLKWPALVWF